MLRTMQKARYDAASLGHFGLAAEHYTHFTSPIRRYPDLVVHRMLRESRHGEMTPARREELDEDLPEIGEHTSEMERRADEAERELLQWKKVRFMADKVGDEYDGFITGVAPFGLFIELIEHYVEGLVHISSMADDYYRFVEQQHILLRREHQEDVPARRQGAGAGRPGRHGAPPGRSWAGGDSRSGAPGRARARTASKQRSKPRSDESATRSAAPGRRERAGEERQRARPRRASLGFSVFELPSLVASLKFLIPLPMPRPSSGSRFAPKIRMTIARMIISSGMPILPMSHLPRAIVAAERLLNKRISTL